MSTLLNAGGNTLNNPQDNTLFGLVGAVGPVDGRGTIRLVVNVDFFDWEIDDGRALILDLPEECAVELANDMASVIAKLQHLRSLAKLGCLTANAFANDDESSMLENIPKKHMRT